MWDKMKEKKEHIDIWGPQCLSDVMLLAAFIFCCVIYVILLVACGVWAILIPILALAEKGVLYLMWWVPCCFVASILIAIGAFVGTKLDII